jgi:hypothetical protein
MTVEEKRGIFFEQNAEENGDLERRKPKDCRKKKDEDVKNMRIPKLEKITNQKNRVYRIDEQIKIERSK